MQLYHKFNLPNSLSGTNHPQPRRPGWVSLQMNPFVIAAAMLVGFTASSAWADPILRSNDTLAICGDSITEQKKYSEFIEDYILMCGSVTGVRVVQFGWSGERSPGFAARVESDILPFKPTVATTCYGMNDGLYNIMSQSTGDTYRQGMTEAIKKLKDNGVRAVVVGSPGCVDGSAFTGKKVSADDYNKTLSALHDIAKDIAEKNGDSFADVFTPMMDVMAKSKVKYGASYELVAGGGIHPNDNGQLVMAYAFLRGLNFDGAIGTITVDMATNKAEGTTGQTIISCKDGVVSIKSTRYPFCFRGDPDKADQSSASVLPFFPFNDDLNRYVLTVKGIKGSKAKITWGSQTKEFTAASLEKGVNLAAEFIDNPFCVQFFKVHAAVDAQQQLETVLVKQFMHSLPIFTSIVPGEVEDLKKVVKGGISRDKELFEAAQKLVVPVDHMIRIESEP